MAYSSSRPRKRKVNKKGRNPGGAPFVQLFHYLLNSPAWQSLRPPARALYVEIVKRFNGCNNGEISLSVREAARLLHIAKDTAGKTFHELEDKGFVRRRQCGSFDWKIHHASTWILTEHLLGDALATRDFMRWRPENSETGPKSDPRRPKSGTASENIPRNPRIDDPNLGPWALHRQASRSQITARI